MIAILFSFQGNKDRHAREGIQTTNLDSCFHGNDAHASQCPATGSRTLAYRPWRVNSATSIPRRSRLALSVTSPTKPLHRRCGKDSRSG